MQPAARETDSLRTCVRACALSRCDRDKEEFPTLCCRRVLTLRAVGLHELRTSAGWIYVAPDLHLPIGVCWHRASTGELTRSASQLNGLGDGGGGWSPGWRRVYLRTINRRRALLLFSAEPSRVPSLPSFAMDMDCPRERPRQARLPSGSTWKTPRWLQFAGLDRSPLRGDLKPSSLNFRLVSGYQGKPWMIEQVIHSKQNR